MEIAYGTVKSHVHFVFHSPFTLSNQGVSSHIFRYQFVYGLVANGPRMGPPE